MNDKSDITAVKLDLRSTYIKFLRNEHTFISDYYYFMLLKTLSIGT